ncbi:MAG: DUF3473 domain-containing protein [Syntrophales bacterium]|nr:DUF3473 domain-containing protein [Syntrophales bacterium]
MNTIDHHILLTVDLEDWFQVENLKEGIPFTSWSSRELRVEENTHRILDLLDSMRLKGTHNPPQATFFVLGWIAERLPHLVRVIRSRGHEVASHGYFHRCCNESSSGELEKDLVDSRKLLEDIIGEAVYGYRAPSFSITDDVLKIIEACGYRYDSSYNSFGINRRYGRMDLTQYATAGVAVKISSTFYELPISNLTLYGRILPWGGGGYFRLIPLFIFRLGVQSILKGEGAYLFYIHPWEIDPGQPRIDTIPAFYRFRHYVNLSRTQHKLSALFSHVKGCSFVTCRDYLNLVGKKPDFQ